MMYRLYLSVVVLMMELCLVTPLPINTTVVNNDIISTEHLQKTVNIKSSTTAVTEGNVELGTQGQVITKLGIHGNVVSSGSDFSKTLSRDELEKKIQTLMDLIRNRAISFPGERFDLPETIKLDLNKTLYPIVGHHSKGSTPSVRERRSHGDVTVTVNCSEHPDLCQQAVAWLQQHDRQVPTSLSHWQG